MPRPKKKTNWFVGNFVGIDHLAMQTDAFRALPGQAVKLLLFVIKKHDGRNNGEIAFTVREAAGLVPCTKNTAGLLFKTLCDYGFLALTRRGAFSVKNRKASTWRITLFASVGGKPATRDFRFWDQATGKVPEMRNTVFPEDTNGTA